MSRSCAHNPDTPRLRARTRESPWSAKSRAPVCVKEHAPWSRVRNAAHAYGFASFTVDPGAGPGAMTGMKVEYFNVVGIDGQLASFESFTLRRPRSD